VVGEKRKNEACAVDGRARAARRTSCLSRLSGVSRVCRRQGVVGFDFHNNHRVRRRRRRKGRGAPAGAKVMARSRRGGRYGTMRWGSHGYKIGINERNRLSSGALQYFNHEFGSSPTRDGRGKRNAGGLRSAWSAMLSLKQCTPAVTRNLYAGRSRLYGASVWRASRCV